MMTPRTETRLRDSATLVAARLKTLLDGATSLLRDDYFLVDVDLGIGRRGCCRPTIEILPCAKTYQLLGAGYAADYKYETGADGIRRRWFQFDRCGCRVIWSEVVQ